MSDIEYEITYLAKELPKGLEELESKILQDIYFPVSVEHPNLRIRRKGDKFELTKKSKVEEGDASMHNEMTVDLTEEEFNALAAGNGKGLKKKRYFYDYQGRTAEIDVFEDNLSGLVLVDFEFSSQEGLKAFEMPDFCLVDVTQEDFIAGGMLAGKSLLDIQDKLREFGYKIIA
ncbi:hypothetical protein GF389_02310 [Candidatus Dojkabacteria bacterium]|nr:hypothetical protein [Candidatus Dojkabacteria bacterium]